MAHFYFTLNKVQYVNIMTKEMKKDRQFGNMVKNEAARRHTTAYHLFCQCFEFMQELYGEVKKDDVLE